MKSQIFPKEIIENTVEVHQFAHKNRSKVIYSVILLSLIIALASLPFIKISVYNTSEGLIRPDKERILLQSSTNGKVIFHNLKNNMQVQKGDTLLLINNLAITQKINNTNTLIEEAISFSNDLKILSGNKIITAKLQTIKYK